MKKRGRGICTSLYSTGVAGGGDQSEAIVRLSVDGTVDILVGSVDLGQGSKTVLAQIVAEELTIPIQSINVFTADTDITPPCFGTFASRITYMTGNAVKTAAVKMKDALLEFASDQLEAPIELLALHDGKIVVDQFPDRFILISEVARKAIGASGGAISQVATYMPSATKIDPVTGQGTPFETMEYATTIAEVEVDTDTGEVQVIRIVSAIDVGKVMNPLLLEGQIEGATVMGLGMALMEDLTPRYPTTAYQPTNFADYVVATAADVPEIHRQFIEKPSPNGPYGAKGAGEFAANSIAPAICNAIYDAVKVRITDLPATPERVLRALKEKESIRFP